MSTIANVQNYVDGLSHYSSEALEAIQKLDGFDAETLGVTLPASDDLTPAFYWRVVELYVMHVVEEIGRNDGEAAGSYVTDGNTTKETATKLRKGIDDGDPEVLDALPGPNLDGHDGPSMESIAADLGIVTSWTDQWTDLSSVIADAYNTGFQNGCETEVARSCTAILAEPDPPEATTILARIWTDDEWTFAIISTTETEGHPRPMTLASIFRHELLKASEIMERNAMNYDGGIREAIAYMAPLIERRLLAHGYSIEKPAQFAGTIEQWLVGGGPNVEHHTFEISPLQSEFAPCEFCGKELVKQGPSDETWRNLAGKNHTCS